MMSYKVYCIVNKKFTDQEYSDFENSQEIVTNPDILFVTKAKISDKVLIGVKQDKNFFTDKYICVQRKYYKACIENKYKSEELYKIKEYLEKRYSFSYFAITKDYVYFNIKYQQDFRDLVDNQDKDIVIDNISFKINTLFNKDHQDNHKKRYYKKRYFRNNVVNPRRRFYHKNNKQNKDNTTSSTTTTTTD